MSRNARTDKRVAAVIDAAATLALDNNLCVSGGFYGEGTDERFTADLPNGRGIRLELIADSWFAYRRNSGQTHWRYCSLVELEREVGLA